MSALKDAIEQNDGRRVFGLLDQETRFSFMSIHRAQRKTCATIATDYPADRREHASQRCALAAARPEPEAYFAEWIKASRRLNAWRTADATKVSGKGNTVTIPIQGGTLSLCKETSGWANCTLRAEAEREKVRAARDLDLVRENAETFRSH